MSNKILFKRMCHSAFFMIGAIIAILIVLTTLLSPYFIQFDPDTSTISEKLISPEGMSKGLQGHIFGTDQMGRDIFTRLLIGGRYSLMISVSVVIISLVLGVLLGIMAGYLGGIVDTIIMRICDIFLAMPQMILAVALMAILGNNIYNLIFVLTLTGWMQFTKVTRNEVMGLLEVSISTAARVLKKLVKSNLLKQNGKGRNTNYTIINK